MRTALNEGDHGKYHVIKIFAEIGDNECHYETVERVSGRNMVKRSNLSIRVTEFTVHPQKPVESKQASSYAQTGTGRDQAAYYENFVVRVKLIVLAMIAEATLDQQ